VVKNITMWLAANNSLDKHYEAEFCYHQTDYGGNSILILAIDSIRSEWMESLFTLKSIYAKHNNPLQKVRALRRGRQSNWYDDCA